MKKLKKGSEVEVTSEKERFQVSWNKAILQQNSAKMKGKKLLVCFITLLDKDSLTPYTETVEQCFISPVQPEYLNKGFVFERGSVVDAYGHGGWWKSVIVNELPNDKFLVYLDFLPDIELSEDIYSTWKIVEMTCTIRKMEDIWVTAMVIKQIEVDGHVLNFFAKYILGDIIEVFVSCGWRQAEVREILSGNQYLVQFKAAKEEAVYKSSARRLSMDWQDGLIHTRERESIEETHSKGTSKSKNDDATPLISPKRVLHSCFIVKEDDMMNGYATEIITPHESYSNTTVLEATENENQIPEPVVELELPLSHESGDTMNDNAASPIIDPQKIPIDGTEDDLMNDAPTPTIVTQESSSSTLVLESNEDDMMNGYATEIITPEESYSNTLILEDTDNETPINEPVVAFELPLPHESDDTMNDDASSPIIDAPEIPIVIEPGIEECFLPRINKRSNLKLVGKVDKVSGREFKKLEDSFLGPIIELGRRQEHMVFSRHLIHRLLLRRIDIGDKDLWISFGEQAMRFSLRKFHLATALPCVVQKDEEKVETSGRKKKKKDPWMNQDQTVKSLLKLLENNSTEFTADQRLRLGASILVEGILMAINPVTHIPVENLLRARDFKEFCKYPWGSLAFNCLRDEVKGITSEVLKRDQYGICGFIYAVQLWALSYVDHIGTFFGIRENEIKFPLCLHRIKTKPLTMEEVTRFDNCEKVDVKCILGDPEMHSDLVEDVDIQFGRVVDIVKRGYRLKRQRLD
ncbi:hypothetical protein Bca101_025770 [Brassica carinata]